MRGIGMVVKAGDARASALADEVAAWVSDCGCQIYISDPLLRLHHAETIPGDEMPRRVEMMLVLGGDGTMLGVGRQFVGSGIPILGINMGRLGFLTDTPAGNVLQALSHVLSGHFKTLEYMSLKVEVLREKRLLCSGVAMNDVVLQRLQSRPIEFDVRMRQQQAFSMRGDGLILATPAGSTAYALSAGGPIMHPAVRAIAVVPICPHTLSNRPIVVSADEQIEIHLRSEQQSAVLNLDGEACCEVTQCDAVHVHQGGKITLIYLPGHHYFNTLRNKLHWADGVAGMTEGSC